MLARVACAHDIPNDVKVQAFVKPEGRNLQLLVRVPMSAMREGRSVRGFGFLDLAAPCRCAPRCGSGSWTTSRCTATTPARSSHRGRARGDRFGYRSRPTRRRDTLRSPPLPADLDLYAIAVPRCPARISIAGASTSRSPLSRSGCGSCTIRSCRPPARSAHSRSTATASS
jgi:hypothetical protein